MSYRSYALAGGLETADLAEIYQGALQVLDEVGMVVPHEQVLATLAARPGVRVDGKRVRFAPELSDALLREAVAAYVRQTGDSEAGSSLRINAGTMCRHIIDLETGELRRPTLKDLLETIRLADSFDMGGVAPVDAVDIPDEIREIAAYKICWENSPRLGGASVTNVHSAEYIWRMAQVLGKPFHLHLWISSPLELLGNELEILWQFRDRQVPVMPSTMPMLGITAPLSLPAAYIQSVAEYVGAIVTVRLLGFPANFDLDFLAFPTNMHEARAVFGSPEQTYLSLLYLQIRRSLGLPIGAYKAFVSMGKQPDAQSAAERMAGVMVGVLAGAKVLYAAGRISLDEIFSAEQLVIDQEIVDYVQRFLTGFEYGDSAAARATIAEVGPGANYLTHETTIDNYRRVFRQPRLFEQASLATWQGQGSQSIREHARQVAKERIARPAFELDPVLRREIERIYDEAVATIP